MIRRSGRVVEGGTLLRCYTSQRGIEGSNPSSSAPIGPRLQHKREAQDKGWKEFRPLLHQQVHQRSATGDSSSTCSTEARKHSLAESPTDGPSLAESIISWCTILD